MARILLVAGWVNLERYELSYWDRGEKVNDEEEELLVCRVGDGVEVIMTDLARQQLSARGWREW